MRNPFGLAQQYYHWGGTNEVAGSRTLQALIKTRRLSKASQSWFGGVVNAYARPKVLGYSRYRKHHRTGALILREAFVVIYFVRNINPTNKIITNSNQLHFFSEKR
jgi:hypothetical protein